MVEKNIVVAVTGASGSMYAKQLLETLAKYKGQYQNLALVFTDIAREIWKHEIGKNLPEEGRLTNYDSRNLNAPFASGSSRYNCLIVCPCSMGMLARIANGTSDDLVARTADVMLKERRTLIVVPREAPYNLIHIQNMERITLAGGIVCPASPSFYTNPASLSQAVQTVVDRILDLVGIEIATQRWGE